MSSDSSKESTVSLPNALRWCAALFGLGASLWWYLNAKSIGEGMLRRGDDLYLADSAERLIESSKHHVLLLLLGVGALIFLLLPLGKLHALPRILCLLGLAIFFTLVFYFLAGANIFRSSENLLGGVLPTEFKVWWEAPDFGGGTFDETSFRGYMLLGLTSSSMVFVISALFLCGLGAGRLRTAPLVLVSILMASIGIPLAIMWHFAGWLTETEAAALSPLLIGAASLALLLTARFFPPRPPDPLAGRRFQMIPFSPPMLSRDQQSTLWFGFFLAICWMLLWTNTMADVMPEDFDSPLPALTALVMMTSSAAGYVTSLFTKNRVRLLVVISACIAGWTASTTGELFAESAFALGILVGVCCALLLWLFDRLLLEDPLGLTAALLAGPILGKVAFGLIIDEHLKLQLLSVVSTFGLGLVIGAPIALLMHNFGWLWKPDWIEETQNAPDSPLESSGA